MQDRREQFLEILGDGTLTGFAPLINYATGEFNRDEIGGLQMVIQIPPACINETCKGIPTSNKDFDILPVLTFVQIPKEEEK